MDQILAEKIADRLRRGILRGTLAPGATIKERDNAAELGVSRTPMREATRILANEGLVVLRPSRSPVVANPSFKEIADGIEVLRALELLSGELACLHASDAEIAHIRALQERMAEQYDRIDKLDRFEIDMNFHRAIARASHNVPLADTHGAFLARLWRARYLSSIQQRSRERVLRQHNAIVEALERRDKAELQQVLGDHLEHLAINIRHLYGEPADGSEAPPLP